jgi:hypothetical protein
MNARTAANKLTLFFLLSIWAGRCILTHNIRASPSQKDERCRDHVNFQPRQAKKRLSPLLTEWRSLMPLHSTRSDVDRQLGSPERSRGATYIYNTPDARLDILYSLGSV